MNIFRDLVDELKEENLLEETVVDPVSPADPSAVPEKAADSGPQQDASSDKPEQVVVIPSSAPSHPESESAAKESAPDTDNQRVSPPAPVSGDSEEILAPSTDETVPATAADASVTESPGELSETASEEEASTPQAQAETGSRPKVRTPEEERKFFKQRAMDEVTGLQLVEHVLTGVEREQMKSVPVPFDDLQVKRALHDFLKIADDLSSPEHAQSEFQLMQETENWASALSRRDRNISVAHLRRYCETTKPSLSSQAMISLARFYRNSPFSESVRSKFDLVFTKLFSKDIGNDKRAIVFKNEELVRHIQELYADWSSVPLYSTDDDDSELLLAALKFQEFINEATDAQTFDELVRRDFFKRLKVFKESCNENFFAPLLIAAAIESNVAVGNRFVDLIEKDKKNSGEGLGDKYGISHDTAISESASKTLELLDMLRVAKPEPDPSHEIQPEQAQANDPMPAEPKKPDTDGEPKARFSTSGGANGWLVIATIAVFLVTGWYMMQGEVGKRTDQPQASGTAKEFTLNNTPLNNHVHSARISKGTLFCITRESWNPLSKEEKTKFLENGLALGKENQFTAVHLLNKEGQSVAFASKTQLAIY